MSGSEQDRSRRPLPPKVTFESRDSSFEDSCSSIYFVVPSTRTQGTQTSQPQRTPIILDQDPETEHFYSFNYEIILEGVAPNSEQRKIIEHPNRYFTRGMATNFYIFRRGRDPVDPDDSNNPDATLFVEGSKCKKLWIFGQHPQNALLINENGVYFYGQDYISPPNVNPLDGWKLVPGLEDVASKIIGFVSGDEHMVAYTNTRAYFWGRNTAAQIQSKASGTRILPIFDDVSGKDFNLELNTENIGDKYIKAVSGRNQTLLLTQQGLLYGSIKNYNLASDEVSSHVGKLSNNVLQRVRISENQEDNMQNYRVIDIACTPDACFIILTKKKLMKSKNTRRGSVFGWGDKSADLLFPFQEAVDVTMPTKLCFTANDDENFVKIVAGRSFVLALNADQQLYFLSRAPVPNHETGERIIPNAETPLEVPDGNRVVNIAAVYNADTAAVMTANSTIYVIGGRRHPIFRGRGAGIFDPTSYSSMQQVFLRYCEPSRPYQTITFWDDEAASTQGAEERPSDMSSCGKKKRPGQNPEDTAMKKQKSVESSE